MKTASSTDWSRWSETRWSWFNPRRTLLLWDPLPSLEFWISWSKLTSSRNLTAAQAVHRACIPKIRRTFQAPDLPHSSHFCRCHFLCSQLLLTKLLQDKFKNLRPSNFRSLCTSLKSSQWKLVVLKVFRLISLSSLFFAPDWILEMETELYELRTSSYWFGVLV